MPRTKKKMRITLPDGITARDVKRALAALRNRGEPTQDIIGVVKHAALERDAEILRRLADENPPDDRVTRVLT